MTELSLPDMPREIIVIIADNIHWVTMANMRNFSLVCKYISECNLVEMFAHKYNWSSFSWIITNVRFAYKYVEQIRWGPVSNKVYKQLNEEFIDLHWDRFDHNRLCRFSRIGTSTMEKVILYSQNRIIIDLVSRFQPNLITVLEIITNVEYAGSLNWEIVCKYHKLPEELMRKYASLLHWENVSQYQSLSAEFIADYRDKLCGWKVAKYQKLSYEFMTQHQEFAYYRALVRRQKFPQEVLSRAAVLRKHVYNHKYYECDGQQHRRTWCWICNRLAVVELTDRLLHELAARLDFNYITRYQQLDEEFMERYADQLNWYNVSQFQELSPEFIEKYRDKLCHKRLRARGLISFTQ